MQNINYFKTIIDNDSLSLTNNIQFLPESGTFLEGIDNVFGIKAIDPYGKGVKITGKIFSADNQEITSFATNESGMDNMTIPGGTAMQYIAKVTLPDGAMREVLLPKAEPDGIILHVYPYQPDIVRIKVQTNGNESQLKKSYLLMIHANGMLFNEELAKKQTGAKKPDLFYGNPPYSKITSFSG